MKNVLVVVDMQNDFIDGSLGTKEAVQIVPAVVSEMEKDEYDTIICTKDSHSENYLETNEGRHLPVKHCVRKTDGWELSDAVKIAAEKARRSGKTVHTIEKPTFGSEFLQAYLKEGNPDRVVFTGLCTDICVVSNALMAKAVLYEKDICIVENATAGVTPEKKEAALETMRSCQIEVI